MELSRDFTICYDDDITRFLTIILIYRPIINSK